MRSKVVIANNLQELRENTGRTLTALAKELGISKSYMSYIEDGKRRLNIEIAAQMAEIYGTNIDTIYRLYLRTKEELAV